MAFTYIGDLSTNRDKVRSYLRDTSSDLGPLPIDNNFSDAELDGLITAEGSWQRAVAGGFETLASAWRRYPSHQADGLRFDGSDIANGYAESAKEWRKRYGGSTSSVGTRQPTLIDGYSDDVASDQV